MKKYLILFLISVNALSATSQVNSVANGGGGSSNVTTPAMTVPLANFKSTATGYGAYTVGCSGLLNGNITAFDYYSCSQWKFPGGQWKVASGKVASCTVINESHTASVSTAQVGFGYATAAFANDTAAASPPTGAKCYNTSSSGTCSSSNNDGGWILINSTSVLTSYAQIATFDASSNGANADIYPFWRVDNTGAGGGHLMFDMSCVEQ